MATSILATFIAFAGIVGLQAPNATAAWLFGAGLAGVGRYWIDHPHPNRRARGSWLRGERHTADSRQQQASLEHFEATATTAVRDGGRRIIWPADWASTYATTPRRRNLMRRA